LNAMPQHWGGVPLQRDSFTHKYKA
jgi:hypothetical protein